MIILSVAQIAAATGIARDWAILVLAIPFLLGLVLQAVILWYCARTLIRFSPQVRPALRKASQVVTRVAGDIQRVNARVHEPALGMRIAVGRMGGFLEGLARGWGRR
ncbi:MAG: hypothetical protein ACOX2L_04880 [Anaerolineae bacterium]|jgi:cytochrome c biogenesis protein CcdA|nr:hypothetical protein [Chloroflexota bacterium]